MNIQLVKQAETKEMKRPGKKPNALLIVKKVTAKKLTLESMPPQNSKHYHLPFGSDANFVNPSGVAAIKI